MTATKQTRISSKEVFNALDATCVRFTQTAIRVVVHDEASSDALRRQPILHFYYVQCSLICREFSHRVSSKKLSYLDIREGLCSLIKACQLLAVKWPAGLVAYGQHVRRIVRAMVDIEMKLTHVLRIQPIPWEEVLDLMERRYQDVVVKAGTEKELKSGLTPPDIEEFLDEGRIGRGGFGVVHKVLYQPTQEQLAMKITSLARWMSGGLRKSDIRILSIDKLAAAKMANAPFFVKTFASFIACCGDSENKVGVIVMEFVTGIDLLRYTETSNVLDGDRVWHLMAQLVTAVESLHLHGFMHRDLKLGNIIVQPSGIIKIIDFELSKVCIEHPGDVMLRSYFRRTCNEFRDHEHAGTSAYMAPEIGEHKPYGRAVDWWSVGVIFYKLLTGKLPYRSKEVSQAVQEATLTFISGNNDHPRRSAAKSLCKGLLRKSPASRFGSMDYMDIFGHSYFSDVDFAKLPVFEMPLSIEELECPRFSARTFPREEQRAKSQVLPAFTGLHAGTEPIDQCPLFTYVSSAIKGTHTHTPKTPSLNSEVETADIFETRSSRDLTRVEGAAAITIEYLTVNPGASMMSPNSTEILAHWNRSCLLVNNRAPIDLREEPCLNESMCFVVRKIKIAMQFVGNGGPLFRGDVILCVNGVKLENMSKTDAIKLMTGSEEPFVVFKVNTNNPFRQIESGTFDVEAVIGTYGKKAQKFVSHQTRSFIPGFCGRRRVFGFSLIIRDYWSEKQNAYLQTILVDKAIIDEQILASGKDVIILLYGDIVLTVNGQAASEIKRIEEIYRCKELYIEFCPCSPLRYKLSD